MAFVSFILKRRNGEVSLDSKPADLHVNVQGPFAWDCASDVVATLLEFEVAMSARLGALVLAAREAGDVASEAFLLPLVATKTDETDEMRTLMEKIKIYSVMPGLIHHLDAMM